MPSGEWRTANLPLGILDQLDCPSMLHLAADRLKVMIEPGVKHPVMAGQRQVARDWLEN